MQYTLIPREVENRLRWHITQTKLLAGLKVKKSGEFRMDGEADLPQITLIDMSINDKPGMASGELTMFLRTNRQLYWSKFNDDGRPGLLDWVEMIQDAIETRPDTGKPDQYLTVFDTMTGKPTLDGSNNEVPLLAECFSWNCKMAQITDASFTMQMDLGWKTEQSRKGIRRSYPFAPVVTLPDKPTDQGATTP